MTHISQIRPGQKVKFYRPHDKQHALTGTVTAVQKNGSMVRIKTDGSAGNVSRIEEAHCDDVFFAGAGPVGSSAAKAEWDEEKPATPAETKA